MYAHAPRPGTSPNEEHNMSRPTSADLSAALGVRVDAVGRPGRSRLPQIAFPSAVVRALVPEDQREPADDPVNQAAPDPVQRGFAPRTSDSVGVVRGPFRQTSGEFWSSVRRGHRYLSSLRVCSRKPESRSAATTLTRQSGIPMHIYQCTSCPARDLSYVRWRTQRGTAACR
jgi:hypothetical protein